MIGASSQDIRLRDMITVEGTSTQFPYDVEQLPNYYTGNITNISAEEFTILLGHKIPEAKWDHTGLLEEMMQFHRCFTLRAGLQDLHFVLSQAAVIVPLPKGNQI